MKCTKWLAAAMAMAMVCCAGAAFGGETVASVKARGVVNVGVSGTLFGFGMPDKQVVWRAAVGEAMVWAPTIDKDDYRIISEKKDLVGNAYHYELTVRRNPNLFARRPSTRVTVIMEQTAPSRRRFVQAEQQFLQSLQALLVQLTTRPNP